MSSLLTRIISGIIFITLFLSAILFSKESYIILISIFGFLALYEFSKLINQKSIIPYLFLAFLGYISYILPEYKFTWIILGLTLICSVRLIIYLYSEKNHYPKHRFEKLDLSIRYISFSFFFLQLIPFSKGTYNPYLIIGIVVLIWVNDSFAFLVGKNIGKNKLFEKISPKKTIEGFIGGIVFSIIAAVILANYITNLSIINWVVLAIIISVIGTLGDLIESKFKRQAKVKDSGTVMPGHGGILDRLDSLLFVAPFVYLYLHFLL